ncbi:lytic transglycosylase domain-containing protein [Thiohalocapsa sp. ML1]|uniref:lytic transglycosylase domain-containing protein n=1 Tax=Thiohalocapsa sp. ML1 TaxID=1431688 RepID=UPI0020B13118|nr:lytic transglycosylase domain-containing protein [Thiohalocapsa sp. ML1]
MNRPESTESTAAGVAAVMATEPRRRGLRATLLLLSAVAISAVFHIGDARADVAAADAKLKGAGAATAADAKRKGAGAGAAAPAAPERKALPRPPSKSRPGRAAVNKLIETHAARNGLDRALVHAVVRAESGYNAHAVSPAGAVGLMQLMPATAADYGVQSVSALFDASTNVRIGTRHLKRLVSRYGIGKAVMAYNAGEGALERHGGFVRFAETQRYTHTVLSNYLQTKGVSAYSDQARQITGITLTPTMASAGGGSRSAAGGRYAGRLTPREQARRMRRADLSTLSLKVRPSLSDRALDPSAHDVGPESKPMFVLERPVSATN